MSGTQKRERPRGIEAGSPDEKGERGIEGGCQGKSHAIFPCVGTTMMRFRKGQWHPSVGSVFSGSVSPPPSSWSVNPCHSHLPSLMMRGLGGPKVAAPTSGLGHLTPPCNSCLMPLVRTKPASVPHSDPTWPPPAQHNAIGRVIISGPLCPISPYMQRGTV